MGLKDPKGIRIRDKGTTPSKTNMEPENISLNQRNIYTNHQFLEGSTLIFGGYTYLQCQDCSVPDQFFGSTPGAKPSVPKMLVLVLGRETEALWRYGWCWCSICKSRHTLSNICIYIYIYTCVYDPTLVEHQMTLENMIEHWMIWKKKHDWTWTSHDLK